MTVTLIERRHKRRLWLALRFSRAAFGISKDGCKRRTSIGNSPILRGLLQTSTLCCQACVGNEKQAATTDQIADDEAEIIASPSFTATNTTQ